MKLKWNKTASVTRGGKAFFWYNTELRLWIVWDRLCKQYELKGAKKYGLFPSVEAAKEDAEKLFNS